MGRRTPIATLVVVAVVLSAVTAPLALLGAGSDQGATGLPAVDAGGNERNLAIESTRTVQEPSVDNGDVPADTDRPLTVSDQIRLRSSARSASAIGENQTALTVRSATLHEADLAVHETATVTATVANNGTTTATRNLTLQFDGEPVERKTVTVPAGEQRRVTFAHETSRTGAFTVSVGEVEAGTLTVIEVVTEPTPTVADSKGSYEMRNPSAVSVPGMALLFLLVMVTGTWGYYYHLTRYEGHASLSERLQGVRRES
jgi:hypothetical protein